VAFGLGGVLVEVLKDITFRLAPPQGRRLIDARRHPAHDMLKACAVRPVSREALADVIVKVSRLVSDFPKSSNSISTRCSYQEGPIAATCASSSTSTTATPGAASDRRNRSCDEPHHAAGGRGVIGASARTARSATP